MIVIYNILLWLTVIVTAPLLFPIIVFSPKRRQTVLKRLGFQAVSDGRREKGSGPIWVQALSVGEVTSAVPLITHLKKRFPDHLIYFSATTATGFQTAETLLAGQVDEILYFPYDLSPSVKIITDRVKPELMIIVETDIWPNFMRHMARRKTPAVLVNARLSDRTLVGYKRLACLMRPTLERFDMIGAQTDKDAARFLALGVSTGRVTVTGNIKCDQEFPIIPEEQRRALKNTLRVKPSNRIIVAGSTHQGEETILAEAMSSLRKKFPALIMIVAPRDPARAGEAGQAFESRGLTTRSLSALSTGDDHPPVVITVDRLGLLRTLYVIADIAIIGGSLVNCRGHNPLEAAAYARPILFGPHMDDFEEIADSLTATGGAVKVTDADSLSRTVAMLLTDKAAAARTGQMARKVLIAGAGAMNKTMALIQQALSNPREASGIPIRADAPPLCFPFIARPLSFLYGCGVRARRALYEKGLIKQKKLPCPVISIGNITTGGTGKTPLTIFLAALLQSSGFSPLVLSRGYRGSMSATGGAVSDGHEYFMTADQSGDEPLMMARALPGVPVVIGKNRYRTALASLNRFRPDVIILDDGFQHLQLARNMDIVLLDNAHPLSNGRLLPAGFLREPVSCLRHADVIVFTRAEIPAVDRPPELTAYLEDRPVFTARHTPLISRWITSNPTDVSEQKANFPDNLSGRRAFAFCGLGDNTSFLNSLEYLGALVAGHLFFRDHHAYTARDMTAIAGQARMTGSDLLVTSEKDLVKLESRELLPLPLDLAVVNVTVTFNNAISSFETLIKTRMAEHSSNSPVF